jgi:hypothetical protein
MTPLEYWSWYRHLDVELPGGDRVFGIDVHEYRNAGDYYKGTSEVSADHEVTAGLDVAWPALKRAIRRNGKSVGAGKYEVRLRLPCDRGATTETVELRSLLQPYHGKGSPEEIRQALRLATAFELVEPTVGALNTYCSRYIGLDCSGFVGNYLRHEGSEVFGPNTPAREFAPSRMRLSRLDQVEAKCVLSWKHESHVAIINHVERMTARPGGGAEVVCWVCESCGSELVSGDAHTDGMNVTRYTIKEVDANKVFKVRRGIGGVGLNAVYIAKVL